MNNQPEARIIETANLQLIPCELAHVEAIMRDKKELEGMLGVKVPDNWLQFPESMPHVYQHLKSDSSALEWGFRLFVHAKDGVLIGEGGFKGKPDEEGVVEIGYALVPEYRRRGLASEAARGLADYAFSHAEVNIVQAHTLKDGTASINVLKRLGMTFVGTAEDPDEGEVLRWRVERKDYSIADFGLRNAD
jgi:RimJ/RimL family protein N-acetyltransferase